MIFIESVRMSELNKFEEIGVYLKLSNDVFFYSEQFHKKLSKHFANASKIKSVYHITLYQGRIEQQDMKNVYSNVGEAATVQKPFLISMKPHLNKVGNNIFWEADSDNVELQNLHEKLLTSIFPFKSGTLQQFQNLDFANAADDSTVGDIKIYGMANVKKRYNPHVTVAYQVGEKSLTSEVSKANAVNFLAESIGVGRIGYYGNVIEELATFKFLIGH